MQVVFVAQVALHGMHPGCVAWKLLALLGRTLAEMAPW